MCSPGRYPPQDWALCWRGESLCCTPGPPAWAANACQTLQLKTLPCPWSARGCLCRVAALRFTAYSQLEYITAAMLARHVKPGGARVLQVPALSVLCCAVLCCAVLCWQDSKR